MPTFIQRTFQLLLMSCTLVLSGCERPPELQSVQGFAQGTTYSISWWSDPPLAPANIQQVVNAELARIDKVMSNYRPDSVVEAFNSGPANTPIEVGQELVALVRTAHQVSVASGGCYDLTIRPLYEAWGFAGEVLTQPSAEKLDQLRPQIGFANIEIVDERHLRKPTAALRIDTNSIGQGYAVQRLANLLEAQGVQDYLIELGGEMRVRGRKPEAQPWRVAVERPTPGEQRVHKVINVLDDQGGIAVVTSGTYRHYFDAEGTRYAHVLDARTGRPVSHDLVSVTVLHDDAGLADAWSTALLCLGPDAALQAADQAGLAALLIRLDGEQFIEQRSAALNASTRWQIE